MLKKEMEKLNYNKEIIEKCYLAIINHKWNMEPKTLEGTILKDADKLSWLGKCRWKNCLLNNQKLDDIIELLPRLRNELLYFEQSKKIYDRDTVSLIKILYANSH